jgi:hypothetical protein
MCHRSRDGQIIPEAVTVTVTVAVAVLILAGADTAMPVTAACA